MFNVKIISRHPDYIPTKTNDKDAGYDLKTCIEQDNTDKIVRTIYEKGLEINFLNSQSFSELDVYINGKPWKINLGRMPHSEEERLKTIKLSWLDTCKVFDIEDGKAICLKPNEVSLVSTGFRIKMPAAPEGFNNVFKLYPRSGLGIKTKLILANTVGIVDETYIKEEVGMGLLNNADCLHIIGDRIRVAQGLFSTVRKATFESCVNWDESEDRGGGFGHSGVN